MTSHLSRDQPPERREESVGENLDLEDNLWEEEKGGREGGREGEREGGRRWLMG